MSGMDRESDLGSGSVSGKGGSHSPESEPVQVRARLSYVELPAERLSNSLAFFESAFGWSLTRFGPTYAATTTGDVDLGLQGEAAEASAAPLPVIEVDDLERALEAVRAAGGEIIRTIFSFPGGRRFHAREPSGNEFAVCRTDHD